MSKRNPFFRNKNNAARPVKLRLLLACLATIIFTTAAFHIRAETETERQFSPSIVRWWSFQSIDTMKYSRDTAREKLTDPDVTQEVDQHILRIAKTGATHVAIATPYDEEFIPILKLWVQTTRKYGLNVWFRGNWSGWEKWFDYSSISRAEHLEKTKQFIASHKDLFANGDVFSACPECENGGPGDPRNNRDAAGHRKFLIDEYRMMREEFINIGKKVTPGFNSMNGDVARLIMDKETTAALGGYIVVDHYVKSPEKLANDIRDYAKQSGGKVILGEYGAPIPDIHGNMNEDEQQRWIEDALTRLIAIPELEGLSYWTDLGGSTELWTGEGKEKKAVQTITSFYRPVVLSGTIENAYRKPVEGIHIKTDQRDILSNADGTFSAPILNRSQTVTVSGEGYASQTFVVDGGTQPLKVRLLPANESFPAWLYRRIYEKLFL